MEISYGKSRFSKSRFKYLNRYQYWLIINVIETSKIMCIIWAVYDIISDDAAHILWCDLTFSSFLIELHHKSINWCFGIFQAKGASIGDVFVASDVAFHDRRIPIPVSSFIYIANIHKKNFLKYNFVIFWKEVRAHWNYYLLF